MKSSPIEEELENIPVKRNPLLVIIATALALGVLFVAILALASFLSGGRRTPGPLAVGGGNVALVKIEGLLVNSDARGG